MDSDITLSTPIEDLVAAHPASVSFLMEYGIRCLICGEPSWGTLGDAMREKGLPPERQVLLLAAVKRYIAASES